MREPGDVVELWQAAWNTGDADAIANLFTADADFVNVVGLWWHKREHIRAAHAFGFSDIFPGSTVTMRAPRVRYLGHDTAVVQSRWHMVGQTAPDGTIAKPRNGILTFVLEKIDGRWIAVTAQNTDIVPGAQTHLNTGQSTRPAYYRPPSASQQ